MRRNFACLAISKIFSCIPAVPVHAQETQLRAGQIVPGSQEKESAGSFLDTVVKLWDLTPGCRRVRLVCITPLRPVDFWGAP
jgi:hypothetical protein